jgi:hypothetical protein
LRLPSSSGRAAFLAASILAAGAIAALTALASTGSDAASPPPGKRPAPAKAVDSHGYPRTFHLYGSAPVEQLARYDMLVGFSTFRVAQLRARNPTGIFLLQPSLGADAVHVTAPGGAVGWTGATDSIRGGKMLGTVRRVDPERDFLHNADGSVATIGKVLGWNLAAPTGTGVPDEVAKTFAYAAKQGGLYGCTVRVGKKFVACWNGVHSDNWIYSAIGASWFYGPNLDADRDGRVDDAGPLRRNWSNGLTRVGTLLRSYLPGLIVGGNGIWYRPNLYGGADPSGWLKASNYTLVENMQTLAYDDPDTYLATARRWLDFADPLGQPRYMAATQTATDSSGKVLVWPNADPNTDAAMVRPDVLRSMRWGLTLSMMVGVYYELRGDYFGPAHNVHWWFDEYDGGVDIRRRGYLGRPLGPYKKLGDGVYRRDFQGGIALNNSSSEARTIGLGGTFKRLRGTQDPSLNDGSTVSSVTIPAKDGTILLRAAKQ